ncbi:TetR/AcrR family transcriptional regulator [Saccharopolyspora sp. NPDC000359]|uniref:TetR/AcrR family transcriptional regulator n=1 Tax=Saccharopolyspora sp. NPDC000359 TaxID=3154251 RepID=UPI00332AB1AB
MKKGARTRQQVLETAMELFNQQGYHGTGVNQVLAEASAPRGSLYFHFPGGKQQLAAEAVTASGRQVGELLALLADRVEPREAIAAIVGYFEQALVESDFRRGCPVATVALEASAESPEVRSACGAAYGLWQEQLAEGLRGWGIPAARADELAVVALSLIEGALLLCKVQHDVTPLRTAGGQLTALVEAARTEAS